MSVQVFDNPFSNNCTRRKVRGHLLFDFYTSDTSLLYSFCKPFWASTAARHVGKQAVAIFVMIFSKVCGIPVYMAIYLNRYSPFLLLCILYALLARSGFWTSSSLKDRIVVHFGIRVLVVNLLVFCKPSGTSHPS